MYSIVGEHLEQYESPNEEDMVLPMLHCSMDTSADDVLDVPIVMVKA